MSRRLMRQRGHYSKIYDGNGLSLASNNDQCHEKMWDQKVEEAKHVQQQRQIDRILMGIVKERLFGQLLAHQTRLSQKGYYTLDRLNKEFVNPTQIKTSRKITPLKNIPIYDGQLRSKHKTIDVSTLRKTSIQLGKDYSEEKDKQVILPSPRIKKRTSIKQQTDFQLRTKRSNSLLKQISISKIPNFNAYFRQLAGNLNNSNVLLYDIRLCKEQLLKYNKQKDMIIQNHLQKFLHFFSFPAAVNVKQYGSWIEYAANCTMTESNFLVFQFLDSAKKGVITTSDLFNTMQDFPLENSYHIEKELYTLMQKIKQIKSTENNNESADAKPPIQEILLQNRTLRLQDMRELLKQSSKELISTDIFKSTTYHKSLYALQHHASVREKISQLEFTQQKENKKDMKEIQNSKVQQGIKFGQFNDLFQTKRSKLFLLVLRMLTGVQMSFFE